MDSNRLITLGALFSLLACQIGFPQNESESLLNPTHNAAPTDYDLIKGSVDYAKLSIAAYGDIAHPTTYEKVHSEKGVMGFEAATYRKESEIVVAFAGTELKQATDILTDGHALMPTSLPIQFREASEYVAKVKADNPDSKITLTGHSLGGQLALYVGGTQNLDAIAFNAPPPNLKMRQDISRAKAIRNDTENDPLALNLTAREGYTSHLGATKDLASDGNLGFRGSYGDIVQVPVQGKGTAASGSIRKAIGYPSSILSYHGMTNLAEAMESLSTSEGLNNYTEITEIWQEIDSNQEAIKSSSLPGVDIHKGTTNGGGSAPIALPGINFSDAKTTGGYGAPISLPQIHMPSTYTDSVAPKKGIMGSDELLSTLQTTSGEDRYRALADLTAGGKVKGDLTGKEIEQIIGSEKGSRRRQLIRLLAPHAKAKLSPTELIGILQTTSGESRYRALAGLTSRKKVKSDLTGREIEQIIGSEKAQRRRQLICLLAPFAKANLGATELVGILQTTSGENRFRALADLAARKKLKSDLTEKEIEQIIGNEKGYSLDRFRRLLSK